MPDRHTERRVFRLLEPVVEAEGYELVAVLLLSEGGTVLRVCIDGPSGVSLEGCSRVTHVVSPVLDVEDPIGGPFRLEVSSPGIDRPLQREEDFVRYQGFKARVRLEDGPGRRRYTGVLAGREGDHVVLVAGADRHLVPVADIARAHLVLDLDEYEALARNPPPRAAPSKEMGELP